MDPCGKRWRKKKKKKNRDLPGEEYTLITHTHTRTHTHAPHLRPTATGTTYLFTRMLGAQCPMAECQQLSSPSTQDVACALSRLVLGKMWKWLRAGSIWNSRWGSPEGVTTEEGSKVWRKDAKDVDLTPILKQPWVFRWVRFLDRSQEYRGDSQKATLS